MKFFAYLITLVAAIAASIIYLDGWKQIIGMWGGILALMTLYRVVYVCLTLKERCRMDKPLAALKAFDERNKGTSSQPYRLSAENISPKVSADEYVDRLMFTLGYPKIRKLVTEPAGQWLGPTVSFWVYDDYFQIRCSDNKDRNHYHEKVLIALLSYRKGDMPRTTAMRVAEEAIVRARGGIVVNSIKETDWYYGTAVNMMMEAVL